MQKGERDKEKQRERERESSLVFLLIRTLILLEQSPTLVTSLNLNYFFKGSLSRGTKVAQLVKHLTLDFGSKS